VETDAGAAGDSQGQTLPRRLTRIATWIGGVVLLIAVLDLIGVPASDWIDDLRRRVKSEEIRAKGSFATDRGLKLAS
jgi:hypothetical protein